MCGWVVWSWHILRIEAWLGLEPCRGGGWRRGGRLTWRVGRQKIHDSGNALIDRGPQGPPMRPSCRLDVLESHDGAGMFLTHRPAEKLCMVEDADLGQVARIIANGDGVADIARERGMAVAQPLEA